MFEDTMPIQTGLVGAETGRDRESAWQGQGRGTLEKPQHCAGSHHSTVLGRPDPQLPHSFTEVLLTGSSGRVALIADNSHAGSLCVSSEASQPTTLNRENAWDLRLQH